MFFSSIQSLTLSLNTVLVCECLDWGEKTPVWSAAPRESPERMCANYCLLMFVFLQCFHAFLVRKSSQTCPWKETSLMFPKAQRTAKKESCSVLFSCTCAISLSSSLPSCLDVRCSLSCRAVSISPKPLKQVLKLVSSHDAFRTQFAVRLQLIH